MGQALYRKYRSRSLEDVVGQQHITTTLNNALKSGKISHAYLLTGPRGVGKTSVARILAFAINNIDYSEEPQLDIIEIDAASNRRIDEVRDLRDKVHILPAKAKYKVYIIDEVHMLTREAFNALLKTLEEPPAHVIFILATTEAHKLPDTIVSRTQHFVFKPIDTETLKDHLRSIATTEKIAIDDAALELLAQHGKGSFRDSIGLLDQIRSSADSVTGDIVRETLGIVSEQQLDVLLAELQSGTPASVMKALHNLRSQGISSTAIAEQLGQRLRHDIVEKKSTDTTLLRELLSVAGSAQPDSLLEVIVLDSLFANQPTINERAVTSKATTTPEHITKAAEALPVKPHKHPIQKVAAETAQTDLPPAKTTPQESLTSKSTKGNFELNDWPAVLAVIKKKHNTLYGILRMAEPEYGQQKLTLVFRFAFHEKQLKDAQKRSLVTGIIKDLFDTEVEIDCRLQKKSSSPNVKTAPAKNDLLDTVSNIFGGAEVLES